MKYEAVTTTLPWRTGKAQTQPVWSRWIRGFVATAAVAAAVVVAVATLQPRGLQLVSVSDSRMAKAVPKDSLAISVPAASYEIGDIVAYESNDDTLVLSRIVGRSIDGLRPTTYRLKDDEAASFKRERVNHQYIRGRVELSVPVLGRILTFLRTPLGFAGFVVIPLVVVFMLGLNDARRRWRLEMYESTFYPGPGYSTQPHA